MTDKEKIEETENCDLFDQSNCCNSAMMGESDICFSCGEHASSSCDGCEDFDICNNENKNINS